MTTMKTQLIPFEDRMPPAGRVFETLAVAVLYNVRIGTIGVDYLELEGLEPPISWPWGSSSHELPQFTRKPLISCIFVSKNAMQFTVHAVA